MALWGVYPGLLVFDQNPMMLTVISHLYPIEIPLQRHPTKYHINYIYRLLSLYAMIAMILYPIYIP